jgi:ATP-dependent Clp protease ATP-binding subunit ClpA
MVLANREAIKHLWPFTDTPHVLAALVKEQTGLAGVLLRHYGITVNSMRKAVRRSIPRAWAFHVFQKLPLSADVDAVVSQARQYALSEKYDAVGTGGVLLAMVRYDTQTNGLLHSLGAEIMALEKDLIKYLHRFMVEAPGQVLHLDLADRPAA